jgi:hypothetical protein
MNQPTAECLLVTFDFFVEDWFFPYFHNQIVD